MSLNNLLKVINKQNNEIIESSVYIEVTKKALKFGSTVYQFRNITGFRLTCVGKKTIIPWGIILIGFIWDFFLITLSSFTYSSALFIWILLIFSIFAFATVVNENQPLRYGLLLELNSGITRTFVTNDLEGVTRIVSELCELIEKETNSIYQINIDQRHASIGVGYPEKIKAQKIGSSI